MTHENSRRAFLKRAGALSMAGAAGPLALNLAAFGQAAAATADGYKALVCLFMYGGNDYANTLVPYDLDSHQAYTRERPALATPRSALTATVLNPLQALPGGRQYALAPQLLPLLQPFNEGDLAVMLNIGTLVEPTTKLQYQEGSVRLPPKLFSHNDQQSFYQSSGPEGNTTGWGGRLGDVFQQNNGNATFTCINVGANGVFLSGAGTVAYQVSAAGAVPINAVQQPLAGSVACQQAMQALITAPRAHLFEAEYTRIVQRAITAEAVLTPALLQAPPSALFPAGNSRWPLSCRWWRASSPSSRNCWPAGRGAPSARCSSSPWVALTRTVACWMTTRCCWTRWARPWLPSTPRSGARVWTSRSRCSPPRTSGARSMPMATGPTMAGAACTSCWAAR